MKTRLLVGSIVFMWVIASCSFSLPSPNVDQNAVATQSALLIESGRMTATSAALETQLAQLPTLQAQETKNAGQPTAAPTETLAPQEPTATRVPPTATVVVPSLTPLPSFTPIPSFTPLPTATIIPCDRASFVSDITIPDGTEIAPGAIFTKIWRIKNSGTCTWTTSYKLVFFSGDRMGGSSPQAMPATVAPGDVVDLSVTFTAPTDEGSYRSRWKLQNASGNQFGVGGNNATIYVDIKVKQGAVVNGVDFVAQMCAAEWTSGAGTLTCPGVDGDAKGFVLRISSPVLESGTTDDEPALLTNPQAISDGVIRGKFPGYTVKTGDKFNAVIGCAYQADKCDVKFQLDYQIGTDSVQTLATWSEIYDQTFHSVEVDLSSLVGKQVRFILTVFANGEMKQDRAQWLAPRIVSQ
jgi:hypothetical protein